MSTLFAVHNSSGCVGRCDSRCYSATSPETECDCICGGRNHGVGRERAMENVQERFEDLLSGVKPEFRHMVEVAPPTLFA